MDLNQIVENSITYNGPSSNFTQTAEKMRESGLKSLEEVSRYTVELLNEDTLKSGHLSNQDTYPRSQTCPYLGVSLYIQTMHIVNLILMCGTMNVNT